jgi:tetratricopeptide (TPR) repeat protein
LLWPAWTVPLFGAALAAGIMTVLILATHNRNATLSTGITAWTDAIKKNRNNIHAYYNLAGLLLKTDRLDEAIWNYEQAALIDASRTDSRLTRHDILVNWGLTLIQRGKIKESVNVLAQAVEQKGDSAIALNALATALAKAGKYKQSIARSEEALRFLETPEAHCNLGATLLLDHQVDEAMKHLNRALELNPDMPDAHSKLGMALDQKGQTAQAVREYRRSIQIKGDNIEALNNLAWIQATHEKPEFRDGRSAVDLAERVCQLTSYNKPDALDTLAAAYAEAGRFDDALKIIRSVLAGAQEAGNKPAIDLFQKRLELYKAKRPLRQSATAPS